MTPLEGETNSLQINYDKVKKIFTGDSLSDPTITKDGVLTVNTPLYPDDSENLSVAVCAYGLPVFISAGIPVT